MHLKPRLKNNAGVTGANTSIEHLREKQGVSGKALAALWELLEACVCHEVARKAEGDKFKGTGYASLLTDNSC